MTEEQLGGATLHCEESGVSDHFAFNEPHSFQLARSIVSNLGNRSFLDENSHNRIEPEEPLYD